MSQRNAGMNFEKMLAQGLDAKVQAEIDAGKPALIASRAQPPVAAGGAWSEFFVQLADISGTVYPANLSGYAIEYCQDGSSAGMALDFDFGGGGKLLGVLPGTRFTGFFQGLSIAPSAGPTAAERLSAVYRPGLNFLPVGRARLLLRRAPNVDYAMLPGILRPSEHSYTQLYNSLLNVPVNTAASMQGVPINGATGVRACIVPSDSSKTIAGGTGVWWYYSPLDEVWFESEVVHDLKVGASRTTFEDEVLVRYGRAFLELRSYTDTNGSGTPNVLLQSWGQP